MTVQDTRAVDALAGLDLAPQQSAAPPASRKPVRRLPVQKDWPTWALVTVQIGILVGALSLWEIGARTGWIDAFFWSQPSAIANTHGTLLRHGRRLDRHQLHLPLDHFRLPARDRGRLSARPVVLVVAQLRRHRPALHHLPGVRSPSSRSPR